MLCFFSSFHITSYTVFFYSLFKLKWAHWERKKQLEPKASEYLSCQKCETRNSLTLRADTRGNRSCSDLTFDEHFNMKLSIFYQEVSSMLFWRSSVSSRSPVQWFYIILPSKISTRPPGSLRQLVGLTHRRKCYRWQQGRSQDFSKGGGGDTVSKWGYSPYCVIFAICCRLFAYKRLAKGEGSQAPQDPPPPPTE